MRMPQQVPPPKPQARPCPASSTVITYSAVASVFTEEPLYFVPHLHTLLQPLPLPAILPPSSYSPCALASSLAVSAFFSAFNSADSSNSGRHLCLLCLCLCFYPCLRLCLLPTPSLPSAAPTSLLFLLDNTRS